MNVCTRNLETCGPFRHHEDPQWSLSKIVVRADGEAEVTLRTLVTRISEEWIKSGRALTKWMRNGARAQALLNKAF